MAKKRHQGRRTKIVCTLGPATNSATRIEQIVNAGMDVARLNLSHGTHSEHAQRIEILRELSKNTAQRVAVLMDLPGPKHRTGQLRGGSVFLKTGTEVFLTSKQLEGDETRISVVPPSLLDAVRPGDRLFLSDGVIQLKVEEVDQAGVKCKVIFGGRLTAGQGVVVPGLAAPGAFINANLCKHIDFAIESRPDFIALSFVSSPDDVIQVRKILQKSRVDIPIVSKIERGQALAGFDDILAASDAIMIARGDLGVDIPIQKIGLVQKSLIRRCNRAGKPVITATQMLESMVNSPRPTRAEVTDITNAIFDGTDALMLSGETSIGMYPKLCVEMMAQIAQETEHELPYKHLIEERSTWVKPQTDELISYDACYTASRLGAAAIVAFTESGSTAQRVSKYRPAMPVLAITPNESVCGKLMVCWGVQVFHIERPPALDDLFTTAAKLCKELGIAQSGDLIVVTGGIPVGVAGTTNLLKIEKVP